MRQQYLTVAIIVAHVLGQRGEHLTRVFLQVVKVEHHKAIQVGSTLQPPSIFRPCAVLALVLGKRCHEAEGRQAALDAVVALGVALCQTGAGSLDAGLERRVVDYCFEGFAVARAARRTKS